MRYTCRATPLATATVHRPACDVGLVPVGEYLFNHAAANVSVNGQTFLRWFIDDCEFTSSCLIFCVRGPVATQIYLARLVLEIQTLVVFTLVSQLVPSNFHIDCYWRDPADDYWSTSGPSEMNQTHSEDLGFSEEQTQVCCGLRARSDCMLWPLT